MAERTNRETFYILNNPTASPIIRSDIKVGALVTTNGEPFSADQFWSPDLPKEKLEEGICNVEWKTLSSKEPELVEAGVHVAYGNYMAMFPKT